MRQNVNGVAGLASPFFNFNRKQLMDFMLPISVASVWEAIAYIRDGEPYLPMVPVSPEYYRRSAKYINKILKGTKPSDLPVQQPTRFELAVNLKTAKLLGSPSRRPWLGRPTRSLNKVLTSLIGHKTDMAQVVQLEPLSGKSGRPNSGRAGELKILNLGVIEAICYLAERSGVAVVFDNA